MKRIVYLTFYFKPDLCAGSFRNSPLAVELAKRKITVNCVAPGLIETDMAKNLMPEQLDEILPMIPTKRMGQPEEVASLVNYLMSDGAAYITRQVIAVSGGLA